MSDRYDDSRGISMLVAGFGLGTLVGTVIGLLIAPKSGRELRADIADYSKDYYDKAREYGKDYYEKAKDYSRETYDAGREKARQAYEAGRERAREYSSNLGEKITEAKEHLGERAKEVVNKARGGGKQSGKHDEEEA